MKNIFYCSWLISAVLNSEYAGAATDNFELITYKTEDAGLIEASFFEGDQGLAVIFAHGAVFNKESWYFLAERLQKEDISSLCIDFRGYGSSTKGTTDNKSFDILGAVDFLKEKNFYDARKNYR